MIVYALFGPSNSGRLAFAQRTWLRNKSYVFVPDKPSDQWSRLYHPLPTSWTNARFRTDANMLWAIFEANRTFASKFDWIFVGDDDTIPFETTVTEYSRAYDASKPVALGVTVVNVTRRHRILPKLQCLPSTPTCAMSDDITAGKHCCTCPVIHKNDEWIYDASGRGFYHPTNVQMYGGTGIMLSRGILDNISQQEWKMCAQRLVCGPGDYRVMTCLQNLLTDLKVVHINRNAKFTRRAIQGSKTARCKQNSLLGNIYVNTFWSTMYKDPVNGPLIFKHLKRECPWSIHKLSRECENDVMRQAAHCFGHEYETLPSRKMCWNWIEKTERKRLGQMFGLTNHSSFDLDWMYAKSQNCTM